MKTVAILIAASPTRAFYSQIAALRLALNGLHWLHWRPTLHVYVGGPEESGALADWSPYLDGVELHVSSPARYDAMGDWAQSDDVFACPPSEADAFLAMDADTFPVDTLEPMLDTVLETGAVGGVIAHYPPPTWPATSVRHAWQRLTRGLVHTPLDFRFSHTLMAPETAVELREAPFYLNFGVVFFPRPVLHTIAPTYLSIRPELMDRLSSPDFSGQAALTLALAAHDVRPIALSMRYNFPNDPVAERMYPLELANVAVFHYLRTSAFDRHRIFASVAEYEGFLNLSLDGVNRRFQDAVRRILGPTYPFR